MSRAVKYTERAVTILAQGAWSVFERVNRISPNASFTPKWSEKPLLKSYQKEKAPAWLAAQHRLVVPQVRA